MEMQMHSRRLRDSASISIKITDTAAAMPARIMVAEKVRAAQEPSQFAAEEDVKQKAKRLMRHLLWLMDT